MCILYTHAQLYTYLFIHLFSLGDLEHTRVVKLDRHLKYALDNGMSSHAVCAKTGESVS